MSTENMKRFGRVMAEQCNEIRSTSIEQLPDDLVERFAFDQALRQCSLTIAEMDELTRIVIADGLGGLMRWLETLED